MVTLDAEIRRHDVMSFESITVPGTVMLVGPV